MSKLERYNELLKKEKQIGSEKMKSLPEGEELRDYQICIIEEKYWQNQFAYFDCIQKFLTGSINGEEMYSVFNLLWKSDRDRRLSTITEASFERDPEKVA